MKKKLRKNKLKLPTINFERQTLKNDPLAIVIGVDEVGRGSWAGPIVACASWINPEKFNSLPKINDSKKMSKKNRRFVFDIALNFSKYSVCSATVREIEILGINDANDLASLRAIFSLINFFEYNSKANFNYIVCIDGNRIPNFEKFGNLNLTNKKKIITKNFVKGDAKLISIALSSILAKECRDMIMKRNHFFYPNYNFISNVGYGTKEHRIQIDKFGITKFHRKNFKPINTISS